MAIKISGTTVIDNSGNFTNIANTTATTLIGDGSQLTGVSSAADVVAPFNVSPADGTTRTSLTPTLEASRFISLFDRTHANTQFQVSIDSGFSNTEVDVFTGANTTLTVPSSFDQATEHFFRVRYFDNAGCCSAFSEPTSFTTGDATDFGTLGGAAGGGFYMGTICAASTCYYLIMAPAASGQTSCQWKTVRSDSGVGNERCDGYGNTYDHLANSTHPAGNWTATRTIGGFSDWYLPAMCELRQLYINCNCPTASEQTASEQYWSSTERTDITDDAFRILFSNGNETTNSKNFCNFVRAIRREPFPS